MRKYPTTTLSTEVLGKAPNKIFVETGTYCGDALRMAIDMGFEKIHSMEIQRDTFRRCSDAFTNEKRISLYHGDSVCLLWGIIKDIDEPVTFWLDAHTHLDHAKGEKLVPILEELEIIKKHHIKTHSILIDDMNSCISTTEGMNHGGHRVEPGWKNITKEMLLKAVLDINPNYEIQYNGHPVTPDTIMHGTDILIATI